jgi:hypothetical protein
MQRSDPLHVPPVMHAAESLHKVAAAVSVWLHVNAAGGAARDGGEGDGTGSEDKGDAHDGPS